MTTYFLLFTFCVEKSCRVPRCSMFKHSFASQRYRWTSFEKLFVLTLRTYSQRLICIMFLYYSRLLLCRHHHTNFKFPAKAQRCKYEIKCLLCFCQYFSFYTRFKSDNQSKKPDRKPYSTLVLKIHTKKSAKQENSSRSMNSIL